MEQSNQLLIWQAVAAIPFGKVATYGQVAEWAGLPRSARLVGTTLRKLPAGSNLPWHRVVRSPGRIAFAKGSPTYDEQKRRLQAEGVVFSGEKIAPQQFAVERPLRN